MRAMLAGLVLSLGAGTLTAQNADSALVRRVDYRSPELGVGYRLAVSEDTLRIPRWWQTPITLRRATTMEQPR